MRLWVPILLMFTAGCDSGQGKAGGSFLPVVGEIAAPEKGFTGTVNTSVVFVNRGTVPLQILEAKTSCSCAVAGQLRGHHLAAGERMSIPLTLIPPSKGSKAVRLELVTQPTSPEASIVFVVAGKPLAPPTIEEGVEEIDIRINESQGTAQARAYVKCLEREGELAWLEGAKVNDGLSGAWEATVKQTIAEEPYLFSGIVRRTYEIEIEGKQLLEAEPIQRSTLQLIPRSSIMCAEQIRPVSLVVRLSKFMRSAPNLVRWSESDRDATRSLLLVFDSTSDWSLKAVNELPDWLTVEVDSSYQQSISNRIKVNLKRNGSAQNTQVLSLDFVASSTEFGTKHCSVPVQFGGDSAQPKVEVTD